jgi:hypothetical protein
MRDIFKKAMTGAMIAGAALTVAACGGGETAANNTATNDLGMDSTYDANATDMGMDTNMTMDSNMTDMNMTNDMNAMTTADNTMAGNGM